VCFCAAEHARLGAQRNAPHGANASPTSDFEWRQATVGSATATLDLSPDISVHRTTEKGVACVDDHGECASLIELALGRIGEKWPLDQDLLPGVGSRNRSSSRYLDAQRSFEANGLAGEEIRSLFDEKGPISGVKASNLLLLGISGRGMALVQEALEELIAVHEADAYMYDHVVYNYSMPSWFLTDLQHAKLFSASLETASTMIDVLSLFQAAWHERRWNRFFKKMSL
jgi:hypothetical protein